MSWAEVHDEAERLEHAVSERLIDRIDDMLGRPQVDPHGDPIPTAEGRLPRIEHPDLLSAPERVPLEVMRVTDQDPEFLRFAEQRQLMPGDRVVIEQRDTEATASGCRTPVATWSRSRCRSRSWSGIRSRLTGP
jgi:DtxR family Mn-dependent transcriptional regulator